ncbi:MULTISPECIES: hypothetical protein [Parageobacillus]|uniref:Uncharacterized protein n=1 Tax=Parageobacillus galactosidasius TaxID=883812 RepID=A0A226QQR2_9BACL|nr:MULTISPECIES: hypothetical protein [Parageobacillus]MED4991038.1 hypothetical protein [Parageobacillus toebii]OXB94675.1 hypothetical protein B9L23_07355 [Parageobacillus galactosidasius]
MKKRKKKRKEKLSRRELLDLMGVNRDTYKRVRGAENNLYRYFDDSVIKILRVNQNSFIENCLVMSKIWKFTPFVV